jgi:hypothetical protein
VLITTERKFKLQMRFRYYLCKKRKNIKHLYGYHLLLKEIGVQTTAELGEKPLKVLSKPKRESQLLQKSLWDNSILDGIAILESEEFKITFILKKK